MGLKSDADGSLMILTRKDKPADTANWLPAPTGAFILTPESGALRLASVDGK
jgi:hypothetical protein